MSCPGAPSSRRSRRESLPFGLLTHRVGFRHPGSPWMQRLLSDGRASGALSAASTSAVSWRA
eukprot:11218308-Lingulodinium_polyedra.AAC.1